MMEYAQWLESRVHDSGSSVIEVSFLYDFQKKGQDGKRVLKWYRSKDKKGGQHPYGSYMLNKKWTLEEEFNNHMLRFQQVTVSSIDCSNVYFDFLGWIVGQ